MAIKDISAKDIRLLIPELTRRSLKTSLRSNFHRKVVPASFLNDKKRRL
jgi:hypothetical protein